MCGFVGGYTKTGSHLASEPLSAALSLLRHRGPDSSGQSTFVLESGVLRFGFRRLAIIDLSSSADQPFSSEDQRFSMVFNGEIYNYLELKDELRKEGYRFRSNSDSEVLLAAWEKWGLQGLNRFIGMFSIVIFDNLQSEIWCIRDAYGIKPFFYSHTNRSFFFASEIAALLVMQGSAPKMNQDIAIDYLVSGEYDRSVDTFFQDVSQLEPGHYFKLDLNSKDISIEPKRWWFPNIRENDALSFGDAAEALKEEFLASVAIHLRSDVPIATALSGGLDSSAIVSAIRKIQPEIDIHTFSYVADDPQINEQNWIDVVNSATTSISHIVELSSREFQTDLDDLIRSQGEPFGSTSLYAQFKIYQRAKDAGVKVMLDGQGADEVLAGYFGYPESRVKSLIDLNKYADAIKLISKWSKWPGRDPRNLIKSTFKYMLPIEIQKTLSIAMKRQSVPKFIKEDYQEPLKIPDVFPSKTWKNRRLIERLLKEQSNGALIALLRHADRNSMRWSIESRVPFLNPRLSELVFSFPEEYLLTKQGETKSVFREAMRGIVDDRILERKDKIGFATPQYKWITHEIIKQSSIVQDAKGIEFLDYRNLQNYLSSNLNTSHEKTAMTWRLFNLVRWKQLMGIR